MALLFRSYATFQPSSLGYEFHQNVDFEILLECFLWNASLLLAACGREIQILQTKPIDLCNIFTQVFIWPRSSTWIQNNTLAGESSKWFNFVGIWYCWLVCFSHNSRMYELHRIVWFFHVFYHEASLPRCPSLHEDTDGWKTTQSVCPSLPLKISSWWPPNHKFDTLLDHYCLTIIVSWWTHHKMNALFT